MKIILLLLLFTIDAKSQSIWSNSITGTNPSTFNPYILGQTTDPNLTVSGIGRGTGINPSSANDRYSASNWNSPSLNPDDYFYFTLQPANGYEIDFTNFNYAAQASGTGPIAFSLRSSLDNYTTEIGTVTGTGMVVSLSSLQNILGPVTFRLYAWGASASTGTFSINSFSFEGTVALTGPLPVRFSNVKAFSKNEGTEISFTNETEENLDRYFIEHSGDGIAFKVLKVQLPESNTGGPASYSYLHPGVSGVNFYRIRALERDGQVSFSKVLKMDSKPEGAMKVFPNPVRGKVIVEVGSIEAGERLLEVFDMLGVRVKGMIIRHGGGFFSQNIDFHGVKAGRYVIRISEKSLQVVVF